MRFTKAEIRDYFDREDRSYRLAILCTHWIRDTAPFTPSAISEANSLVMMVAGRTIAFSDLAAELEDGNRREMISSEFLLNHLHSLVRLPFELLNDYCEDFDKAAGQSALVAELKKMPRYAYTRLVRLSVAVKKGPFWQDKRDQYCGYAMVSGSRIRFLVGDLSFRRSGSRALLPSQRSRTFL